MLWLFFGQVSMTAPFCRVLENNKISALASNIFQGLERILHLSVLWLSWISIMLSIQWTSASWYNLSCSSKWTVLFTFFFTQKFEGQWPQPASSKCILLFEESLLSVRIIFYWMLHAMSKAPDHNQCHPDKMLVCGLVVCVLCSSVWSWKRCHGLQEFGGQLHGQSSCRCLSKYLLSLCGQACVRQHHELQASSFVLHGLQWKECFIPTMCGREQSTIFVYLLSLLQTVTGT